MDADGWVIWAARQHVETVPETAVSGERMAPGGMTTILLGDTPRKEAFIREAMPQNTTHVPEVATPSERLAPGGTATILLGETPDVFARDVAPQHMMMPISGNPSASESAAGLCGVATILLGDTPMKE